MRFLIAALAVLLFGCGKDSNSGGGEDDKSSSVQGAKLVQALTDLPTCDDSSQGALVYVKDDSEFQTCDGGEWSVVDIKGSDGKNGKNGKDGAASSTYIAATVNCYGELGSTGLFAKYRVSEMSTHDLFVYGSISTSIEETGATSFYSKNQNGAIDASVLITNDLSGAATSGFWELSMNRDTLVMTAKYTDIGDVNNGDTYTLASPDCTVQSYSP